MTSFFRTIQPKELSVWVFHYEIRCFDQIFVVDNLTNNSNPCWRFGILFGLTLVYKSKSSGMLSCMDLYGLVVTPGLIPGVEVGVAGVSHDKGFSKVFWVQESMSYFGGRDRSNKVLVDFLENISGVPHLLIYTFLICGPVVACRPLCGQGIRGSARSFLRFTPLSPCAGLFSTPGRLALSAAATVLCHAAWHALRSQVGTMACAA